MGAFSDAWGAISSAFGGSSDSGSQAPAAISSASGELTDAGKKMGGQEAVDANMAANADSESAIGNFFHGITGKNVVGGDDSKTMDAITKSQKDSADKRAQEEQEMMQAHRAGMRSGGVSLPRIQTGDVQQYNPLEFQVKPITPSAGPFTGALNNIRQPFQ